MKEKNVEQITFELGISEKEYYRYEFFNMSKLQAMDKARKLKNRKLQRENLYKTLSETTGKSKKELVEEIRNINQKDIFKCSVEHYEKYELYRYSGTELESKLYLLLERKNLIETLKEHFIQTGEKQGAYSVLSKLINRFFIITEELLPESYKMHLLDLLATRRPEILSDEGLKENIAADMEFSRFVLGFSYDEYVAFDFLGKTVEERKEYLANSERMKILGQLNEKKAREILGDKWRCYETLKAYYDRDLIIVKDEGDFTLFKNFCRHRRCFVKKPFSSAMGNGICRVEITRKTDLLSLMKSLLENDGCFVAEELIVPHRVMKRLNPDSINTVRLETFHKDGKISFGHCVMRIGQKGSFVDNGGAGGILVSVDVNKGILQGIGHDEKGNAYERHPYTGIIFDGYALPEWELALKTARTVAAKIPEVKYIGWDLTYTKKRNWIVVEGNSLPQFIKQYAVKKGLRKDFLDIIEK